MTAPWTLEVVRGTEALATAITSERRQEWQALADEAKRVAVYQGPAFALTWYEVYAPVYEPLVLLGIGNGDHLVGVLPLAVSRKHPERLVFAGAEHCEYAGWVCSAALRDEFPAACIARLHAQAHFPPVWDWGWLAPGTPLGWLEHSALRGKGVTGRIHEATNPILALQDPNRPRFFEDRGKNYKRKVNLLRRLGEVRLVPIDADRLTGPMFAHFMRVYDIRTLARYGCAPFTEDPLKGVFHRRLLEQVPSAALCFALMAGATPVAFFFGLVDKRRAMYCMGSFDQRFLGASPGKLLGDLMADVLRDRGLDYLDHTPGGDAYKEEVASAHERVHRLELFPARWRARAADIHSLLRRGAKTIAMGVGISPERMVRGRNLFALVRGRSPVGLAGAALRAIGYWAWSKDVLMLYGMSRGGSDQGVPPPPPPGVTFRADALEDFLQYTGSNPLWPKQKLMAAAIQRLHGGEHVCTAVKDGALLHYAWLAIDPEVIRCSEVEATYRPKPKTGVLYDAYTDPAARGRGLHRFTLAWRARDAFALGAERILVCMHEGNSAPRRNIEALGFVVQRRIIRRRICGCSWRQGRAVARGADA